MVAVLAAVDMKVGRVAAAAVHPISAVQLGMGSWSNLASVAMELNGWRGSGMQMRMICR
uniref:Uncharacterized protein n=1 Tax=Picea sitchensis TaxID=3332 RepID=A9NX44_PICSI|nr:unknown [Picea sitchensis]